VGLNHIQAIAMNLQHEKRRQAEQKRDILGEKDQCFQLVKDVGTLATIIIVGLY
jgi:hypothetical protein